MADEVRAAAQDEAEKTFEGFMKFSKITTYGALAFFFAVATCNFGVETGPNKTGSQYDGSAYNPTNLNKYQDK